MKNHTLTITPNLKVPKNCPSKLKLSQLLSYKVHLKKFSKVLSKKSKEEAKIKRITLKSGYYKTFSRLLLGIPTVKILRKFNYKTLLEHFRKGCCFSKILMKKERPRRDICSRVNKQESTFRKS